jgi:hypothetical protein
MFTLHRQKDIERQAEHFAASKGKRSVYAGNEHREWLTLFVKVIKKESIFDIKEGDVLNFMAWVAERFNGSEFRKQRARQSIQSFLKFYKCDIL